MNASRPFTLTAAVFCLLLYACNTPNDLASTPRVKPQFSETTPGTDAAEHLAAGADGVYLGGRWNGRPALIKFTRSGNIPWVNTLAADAAVREVAISPGGAPYLVYSLAGADGTSSFFVRKYSPNAAIAWTRQVASGVRTSNAATAAAADKLGNLYLATSFVSSGSAQTTLRKYWADGTLAWQKPSSEYVYNLDVSTNGFLHTVSVGSDAPLLSRYKPDGGLLWRVAAPSGNENQAVAVGGEGQIYVASNDEVYPHQFFATLTKFTSRGARVWQRSVQDGIGLRVDGLNADDQGNAFLALSTPDFNQEEPERFKTFFTYSSGGERRLRRAFDFGSEAPLVGPAALGAAEVYLATSGVGAGGQEALLLRFNGLNGNVTWRR